MSEQTYEEAVAQSTLDAANAKALRVRDQILKEVEGVFEYIEEQDDYEGYFQDMSASEQMKSRVSILVAQEAVRRLADEQLAEILNTAMVKVRKDMFGI